MNKNIHKPGLTSVIINKPKIDKNNLKSDKTVDFKELMKILDVTMPKLFPEIEEETRKNHQDYICGLLTHKGKEYTVRYLKATFESVEALTLQLSSTLVHDKVSLGKDKDGWPTWLGARLKSRCLTETHVPSIRYVFTLCSTRRLITVPTKTNLSSITSTPKWSKEINLVPLLESTEWYEEETLRSRLRNPEIGKEETDHESILTYRVPRLQISLKSSPNGVSFFSFPWDRAAVLSHGIVDALKDFASVYFKGPVEEWLDDTLEPYDELTKSNKPLNVGKVSLTFEGGKLKPRIFAIVDSVTQSLLADLHDDLAKILKNIREDCTFNHDKVALKARSVAAESSPFYGFADLSNATDSLPIYLYEQVGNYLRPNLGTTWVALFDRDFKVSKSVTDAWTPGEKPLTHVRYQTGQPMGALSSWPFMALVHHTLVWQAFGSRKRARGNYLILGDDVVIFDKEAYYKYIDILNTLCVSYTHNVSTVGFEFAKRTFHKGTEVTGAYSASLWASRNIPELFVIEWRNLSSRGYNIGYGLPETFRTLLKVSRTRFFRLKQLVAVPYGTEISQVELAQWCLALQGRSFCSLESRLLIIETLEEQDIVERKEDLLAEALKAFRQCAAFALKQRFQKDLDDAKLAVQINKESYLEALKTSSGLSDKHRAVMLEAYNEVIEEQTVRIRYLERDLKRMYLNPTDIQLLRPNLVDMPRRIDYSTRDKHRHKIKVRAEHQFTIIDSLRG